MTAHPATILPVDPYSLPFSSRSVVPLILNLTSRVLGHIVHLSVEDSNAIANIARCTWAAVDLDFVNSAVVTPQGTEAKVLAMLASYDMQPKKVNRLVSTAFVAGAIVFTVVRTISLQAGGGVE